MPKEFCNRLDLPVSFFMRMFLQVRPGADQVRLYPGASAAAVEAVTVLLLAVSYGCHPARALVRYVVMYLLGLATSLVLECNSRRAYCTQMVLLLAARKGKVG